MLIGKQSKLPMALQKKIIKAKMKKKKAVLQRVLELQKALK